MGLFLRTYFEEKQTAKKPVVSLDSFFRAAHDLRNPLSALNMTIHHLKKTNPHLDHFELLDEAISRINTIAEDILQARKYQPKTIESFDLGESLKDFTREAKFQLQDGLDLDGFESLPAGIQVRGLKADFHRILWNLIQNAQEAKASCCTLTWKDSDGAIILKIRDNGAGIPSKIIEKIGQEGFTTKKRGNGLGLYSAIQTLRSWRGDLKISSRHEVGTTLEIQFTQS